jgi:hypothetical protein
VSEEVGGAFDKSMFCAPRRSAINLVLPFSGLSRERKFTLAGPRRPWEEFFPRVTGPLCPPAIQRSYIDKYWRAKDLRTS